MMDYFYDFQREITTSHDNVEQTLDVQTSNDVDTTINMMESMVEGSSTDAALNAVKVGVFHSK